MLPRNAAGYLKDRLARPNVILTLDVQQTFFAEDRGLSLMGYNTAPMREVLPSIAKLHKLARVAECPLIHVCTMGAAWLNWPHHVAPPAMLERLRNAPAYTTICAPNTPDVEFALEAAPDEGEPIIAKYAFDAFMGTPLLFMLKKMGVETVILSGITTECSVETTARSALSHGFAVVVLEDAVATYDPEIHNASLRVIGESFGIVASVEEVAMNAGWPALQRPRVLRFPSR